MGLRFRRSFKIAPGVRFNVGKKSVGFSIGGKRAGVSINSRTGASARVSAPGTGFSYITKFSGNKNNRGMSGHSSAGGGNYSPVPPSKQPSGSGNKRNIALILLSIFFAFRCNPHVVAVSSVERALFSAFSSDFDNSIGNLPDFWIYWCFDFRSCR